MRGRRRETYREGERKGWGGERDLEREREGERKGGEGGGRDL